MVLAFALSVVEPADSYTDSWAQLVWGVGIWASAIGAVVCGSAAIARHQGRSWMVVLATVSGLLPLALLLSEIAGEVLTSHAVRDRVFFGALSHSIGAASRS